MVGIQNNMPPDPQKAEAEKDAAVKNSLSKIKNKIIVMSGKGGVGKTSTVGKSIDCPGQCRSQSRHYGC